LPKFWLVAAIDENKQGVEENMKEPTYKDFGAVVDKKKVEFKLFFPDATQYMEERGGPHNIKEIRVMGDFQSEIGGKNWDPPVRQ